MPTGSSYGANSVLPIISQISTKLPPSNALHGSSKRLSFPNRCLRVLVSQDYTPDSGAVGYIACAGFSSDPVKFISRAGTPGLGASFLALGC